MKISSLRHLRRQANLLLLLREADGVSALALRAKSPKSHISVIASGGAGIGDVLAAKLERVMEKPPGWMDESHEGAQDAAEMPALSAESASSPDIPAWPNAMLDALAAMLRQIPEDRRDSVAKDLALLAQVPDSKDLPSRIAGKMRQAGVAVSALGPVKAQRSTGSRARARAMSEELEAIEDESQRNAAFTSAIAVMRRKSKADQPAAPLAPAVSTRSRTRSDA